MTFSLTARDPRTGAFGIVLSSSSPAVAARCLHLRAGAGAAASQNVTNPALGPAVLDHLAQGAPAQSALDAALSGERFASYRQVAVVDGAGRVAVHSGQDALGTVAVATGEQCAAAGNLLASEHVVDAMVESYATSEAEQFEQRLLEGFAGAVAAGGEAGEIRSCGLAVVEDVAWRTTDLRVDDSADPLADLTRLLQLWLPQKQDYLTRAVDPTSAPSYGVPGDQ